MIFTKTLKKTLLATILVGLYCSPSMASDQCPLNSQIEGQTMQSVQQQSKKDILFLLGQVETLHQEAISAVKEQNKAAVFYNQLYSQHQKIQERNNGLNQQNQKLQDELQIAKGQATEAQDLKVKNQQITSQLETKDQQIQQLQQEMQIGEQQMEIKDQQIQQMQLLQVDQQFQHETELLEVKISNLQNQQQKQQAQQLMWMQMEAVTEQDWQIAQMIAAQKGLVKQDMQQTEIQIQSLFQEKEAVMLRSQARQEGNGVTALMLACEKNKAGCIPYLMEQAKQQDYLGYTATMKAADKGHTNCLIQSEFGMVDKFGGTALMKAASNGNTECVRVLLPSEAGIIMRDDELTALLMACVGLDLECNGRRWNGEKIITKNPQTEYIKCIKALLDAELGLLDNSANNELEKVKDVPEGKQIIEQRVAKHKEIMQVEQKRIDIANQQIKDMHQTLKSIEEELIEVQADNAKLLMFINNAARYLD